MPDKEPPLPISRVKMEQAQRNREYNYALADEERIKAIEKYEAEKAKRAESTYKRKLSSFLDKRTMNKIKQVEEKQPEICTLDYKGKTYTYTISHIDVESSLVHFPDIGIHQAFLTEDLPSLIGDLPNLIESELKQTKTTDELFEDGLLDDYSIN